MSPAADLNFMFDRAAECMPRADLAALQLSRLKSQLELAYAKVPHVRAKFDAAGVTPDTLKSLDDIRRFPFTTKTDLRDNYPFGLFARAARADGRGCTPRRARPARPPSSATPRATSTSGPT